MPASKFRDLPTEILTQILLALERPDLKRARLICWHSHGVASRLLFKRVHLSVLKRHRDAFHAIASHPHLATAVVELIWEELDLESMDWSGPLSWRAEGHSQGGPEIYTYQNPDAERIFNLINDAKTNLGVFWLPRRSYISQILDMELSDDDAGTQLAGSTKSALIEEFKKSFIATIAYLPNLSTVVSQPMPQDRLIPHRGYHVCASTLCVDLTKSVFSQGSFGLTHFLTPALALYSQLRHLHVADELTTMKLFKTWDSSCYGNLKSLDLCIAHGSDLSHQLYHLFLATRSLESLRICFECAGTPTVFPIEAWYCEMHREEPQPCHIEPTECAATKQVYWPHLKDLYLAHVQLPDELPFFLGRHSGTLKSLVLEDCDVESTHVRRMRHQRCLKLSSFRVRDSSTRPVVSGRELVAFVNNEMESFEIRVNPSTGDLYKRFVTEPSIFDHHICPAAAWHDSKLKPRLYDAESLQAIHGHIPAREIGSEKRLVRRETDLYDESSDEDDDGSKTDGLLEYCRYKERSGIVYWDWCYHEGTWYWWPAEADQAQTKTTNWKFTGRNEHVAYGNDPLVWFEDWDSDAGDLAEATPFGKAFALARRNPNSFIRTPPTRVDFRDNQYVPPMRALGLGETVSDQESPDSEFDYFEDAAEYTHSADTTSGEESDNDAEEEAE
ncbi:hypothetical protein Micbo1qcDRAFT_211933 [Microdochium bolleyi]|uniref:F-box domain-containing protein n=1 Tax=Microdochium bolleyi TaxID=196109 RepID=A0A136JKI4_9PEZI|nr:hypothetical protein Micbo1qcDRAFT_211933 [Microdochium bolleyi]